MPKKIFFIVPYPESEAPSQRFRFEQYFSFLKDQGYAIEVFPFYDYKTWRTLYSQGNYFKKALGILRSFGKRFSLLLKLRKADYLFIHREASHAGPPFFEFVISKVLRRKYIYDFDDAIWLPNYSETNAKFHRLKAYWKIKYCIKWADKVSAGNSFLADYALNYNQNVSIIPTTIDTLNHHNITNDQNQDLIKIGWTGTHTTMQYLDALVPVLKELEEKYSFELIVISNESPSFQLSSLRFVKWKKESEIEDLSKINIGIMPLEDDIWSQGKCGFKGLQYMALGIASIVSPVGVNKTIVQDGINGLFATTQDEWKNALETLLTDADLRRTLGTAGRKTVVDHYSVESNEKNYLNLFS